MDDKSTLLAVRNLRTWFATEDGLVKAVDGVSFRIAPAQTFALVGESGCGKSVTAFSILRLLSMPPAQITSARFMEQLTRRMAAMPSSRRQRLLKDYGPLLQPCADGSAGWTFRDPSEIWFDGADLLSWSDSQMRRVRGGQIGMVFQEPMSSLNPVYSCGNQIVEAIRLHRNVSAAQAREHAIEMLRKVGIPDPVQRFKEYPHQLSGGMRQRVMIAMALSCQPRLLIADEPTTALDVTIQAQILDLLRQIQQADGLSILLITHDLAVVAETADQVAVMYASKLAELTDVGRLFDRPLHPYTQGLFRSLPRLGQKTRRLETIAGNVPNPLHFPSGCKFHPRCSLSRKLASQAGASDTVGIRSEGQAVRVLGRCCRQEPDLREIESGHWCACWEVPGYQSAPATDPSQERALPNPTKTNG